MCEIKRSFEVNGVTYMEAKTGYCYKSTGTFDKVGNPVMRRVGLNALEKAYEEYTALKKEEEDWGAEEQTAKTEAKAEKVQADKETEDAFNKKHGVEIPKSALEANKKYIENSEKKASKPRKSKDVAFVFTPNGDENRQITLTAKQVAFLKLLPTDNFWENGLDSALWIDCLCDTVADQFNPMAVGAMVSTLREKGLITITMERVNGKKCKSMTLTELGQVVASELGLN